MTDEHMQGALTLSRAFDGWWLPRRPLCCDGDYSQLRRRSRAEALRCSQIEVNPAAVANMIVCDIDDEYGRAVALYEHAGALPNFLAENPANGHVHAGWVLSSPVPRTDMARLKPLKLLRAVTEGLRRSVDGDEGYAGLLMHNPLCDVWDSDLIREDAYALGDLAAALEEHGDMPPKSWTRTKRARTVGVGRNCTLFDTARVEAYRMVRRLPDRSQASSDMLREHVRRVCHEINGSFADPLPVREVNDTAKSIHKWITTRSRMWRDGAVSNAATFIAIQSARGHKSGVARQNKFDAISERYAREVLGA